MGLVACVSLAAVFALQERSHDAGVAPSAAPVPSASFGAQPSDELAAPARTAMTADPSAVAPAASAAPLAVASERTATAALPSASASAGTPTDSFGPRPALKAALKLRGAKGKTAEDLVRENF